MFLFLFAIACTEEKQIIESIDYFNTDGLMILKDGEVHYENYWNENKETSRHIIWSVSKSFLSALVGIALDEGLIEDINDPIIKYLKDFKGTGYEGVSIKNLLQIIFLEALSRIGKRFDSPNTNSIRHKNVTGIFFL